jgi:hypothetical protein
MTSRIGLLSLVALSAPLLTACAIGSSTTDGAASLTSSSAQNAPHLIRSYRPVTVDTDFIGRYACANGSPLLCTRTARLLSAVCQCP